ncbi:GAF domain-containing protein [Candidatus Izemoplasma sp. B36]|uniref:GAF domain-containing protein n=1 Tax=Candidatus Izemoplasma sp. B36 TaxID=3242468 RepID=UPI003556CC2C
MDKHKQLIENSKFYLDSNLRTVTNLANLSAYLFEHIDHINWAGFYLFDGEELYLGPFQGKPACTSIKMGSGVCGTSAKNRETLVVDDVHKFNGHITCDSVSESEIVVPIITKNGDLFGVLDIDSPTLKRFDLEIKKALETIVDFLVDIL